MTQNQKLQQPQLVKLDLNNPNFQNNLLDLDKTEWAQLRTTLKKLRQMDWQQVYQDQGLKWEKITSIQPPQGIAGVYSLRVTQSCRAIAYRDSDFMRLLAVSADHDAVYGKK